MEQYSSEEYQKHNFVVVINLKDEDTLRIYDQDEMKAFLYNYTIDELAKCFWDSLKFAYKSGRYSAPGRKH